MQFFLLSNRSVKQRPYIFSVILSNQNKQRLYKIQKRPTSLFYHVLLIKQNECRHLLKFMTISVFDRVFLVLFESKMVTYLVEVMKIGNAFWDFVEEVMESLKSKDGRVDVVSRCLQRLISSLASSMPSKSSLKFEVKFGRFADIILTGTHSLSFNFCYFGSGYKYLFLWAT